MVSSFIFSISVRLSKDTLYPKKNKTTTAIVTNPSDSFKAVEAMMTTRTNSLSGQEINEESDDFFIIPPQFILNPGQEQVITIQWISDKNVSHELPYRLIVQEVPLPADNDVHVEGTNATLKIRLRFVNSFYVSPEQVKENVVGISAIPSENKMLLLIENKGTKHKVINEMNVAFQSLDFSTKKLLDTPTLKSNFNILPFQKRHIFIDWPENIPTKPYTLSLLSY